MPIAPCSTGLTLPVWVAAAAQAALRALLGQSFEAEQHLDQPGAQPALTVAVQSAARLGDDQALAISRCDPGPGLDLTRDLEIWVRVSWTTNAGGLELKAGEGFGTLGTGGALCISAYANELLTCNLQPLLPSGRGLLVEPVLPRGRQLAQRTSNAAFGVVDGLALIGTQAEVQRSAAPEQLQDVLTELRSLAADPGFAGSLVLVIGENGLDLARAAGFAPLLKVARAYGLEVDVIKAEWGQPLDTEAFRTALEADTAKAIKAVILTHSETSTGVINDLETIARHVKAHGTALTLADCVTSLGATNVPMDAWGLDVVASGSQKGYMLPPGLSFVAMSERAWQAYESSDLPKFYLDLGPYRKTAAKDSNPFTPAVNLYFGLEAALEMMQNEGLG